MGTEANLKKGSNFVSSEFMETQCKANTRARQAVCVVSSIKCSNAQTEGNKAKLSNESSKTKTLYALRERTPVTPPAGCAENEDLIRKLALQRLQGYLQILVFESVSSANIV